MESFLEPFVEAVISGLRLGYYTRKEMLAYYDFSLLERKRTIAVTEREEGKSDGIFTSGQVAGGVLDRVTDALAVDI